MVCLSYPLFVLNHSLFLTLILILSISFIISYRYLLFCLEPFTICVLSHPLLFFEVVRRSFVAMHEKPEDPQSLSPQNHKTLKP